MIGAGILGLVLGAALSSNHSSSYAQPGYYGEGYAQPGDYGDSYSSRCTTYSRWDPRWGRYVEESRCY